MYGKLKSPLAEEGEEVTASSCAREVQDEYKGKILLRVVMHRIRLPREMVELLSLSIQELWRCGSEDMAQVWMGQRLDLVILVALSNLNDSMTKSGADTFSCLFDASNCEENNPMAS